MKSVIVILAVASLSACAAKEEKKQPLPDMANPASVFCDKMGGTLSIVKESPGEVGYCTLPSGERIEEWTLYRRDNK